MNIDLSSPQLYVHNNQIQRNDAQKILDEYIHLLRWKENGGDTIMDVGCGPGDVTTQILLPKLPETLQELVGIDLSPKIIDYARKHHQHSLVSYDILDIGTKSLPSAYSECFDHVFSNYCLHWVQDQRQAFKNIFDVLRPGGDVLLLILQNIPLTDVIVALSIKDHWKPYIKEPVFVPVHQYTQNAEEILHNLLQEMGFKCIMCHCRRFTFAYDNIHTCIDELTAAYPGIQKLPDALRAKFVQECVAELRKPGCTDVDVDIGNKFVMSYSSIIIHAMKLKA